MTKKKTKPNETPEAETMPTELVDASTGEVIEVPAVAESAWGEGTLATMDAECFERRLEQATIERERIKQIQLSVMTEGVDYGTIPGTPKPTLFKSGAEILNKFGRLVATYENTREVGDGVSGPDIFYRSICRLHYSDSSGPVVAEGEGSCGSWEKKYRYRMQRSACPGCGKELRKSKHANEWYCWAAKGGCGAKYPLDSPAVQPGGLTENPDPHDLDNTLLKMAQKRGLTAATLNAHAVSGIFTQDLEPHDDPGDGAKTRPPAAENSGAIPQQGDPKPPANANPKPTGENDYKAHLDKLLSAKAALTALDEIAGPQMYYRVLGSNGVEHANELHDLKTMTTVYEDLRKAWRGLADMKAEEGGAE